MTQITMDGVRFLLAGTFDFVSDDDARWALIARAADPEAHVRALVERHLPALRELAAGEVQRFDETLSVTLHPDGRVAILLSIFRGTPLEETARSLLRAERFPRVRSLVRVETKLVLGAA